MAHVYTPGLQISARKLLTRQRTLPIPGQVLVQGGDKVEMQQIVAEAHIPGDVVTINVAHLLGIEPSDLPRYLRKQVGEPVALDEVLAANKPLLKWLKTEVKAPTAGTIESASHVTGQLLIRKPPRPLQLLAYLQGVVTAVEPNLGVEVSTVAALVQGIFGIGGERCGTLKVIVNSPDQVVTPNDIPAQCAQQVLVGGSLLTKEALQKVVASGAAGIIVGGIQANDLQAWLGYDLGVAITGEEPVTTTLILTEGFGTIPMAARTFKLLSAHQGQWAAISGRTQIRAGVLRPEVIIPLPVEVQQETPGEEVSSGLTEGSPVRLIRDPYFGQLGEIAALPPEAQTVETEARVRVAEVTLRDGRRVVVPRANLEAMVE